MSWTGLRMTGGPVKGMYGDCGGGSSRRLGSNPDRPCGLLDPCASKGACTGLRGPLVEQCTGGYPVVLAPTQACGSLDPGTVDGWKYSSGSRVDAGRFDPSPAIAVDS